MLRFSHLPCIATLILLSGCGSGPSSSGYPDLTGNWAFSAQAVFGDFPLGGYITNSNGTVSGTIHNTGCLAIPLTEDLPVSGTLSPSGVLTATAKGTTTGQTITIAGTVSGGTLSGGTFTLSGPFCIPGPSSGPLLGSIVPSYSNTYTGSFVSSVSNLTIGTTIVASQSGSDSDGFYHLSGTVSFSGSPCYSSGTITGSMVAGAFAMVTITTNNGSTVTFTGSLSNTGNTINGDYQVSSGSCNGDSGYGSISHP
jgi:hypothetical protein